MKKYYAKHAQLHSIALILHECILCVHVGKVAYSLHAFTYQFHFVGTESWRQYAPPLPPHFITSRKDKVMCLPINMSNEKTSTILQWQVQN